MKIDTVIRHVTKPEENLFLQLGLPAEEAKRLQLASQKHINDTTQLRNNSWPSSRRGLNYIS